MSGEHEFETIADKAALLEHLELEHRAELFGPIAGYAVESLAYLQEDHRRYHGELEHDVVTGAPRLTKELAAGMALAARARQKNHSRSGADRPKV